MRLSDVRMLIRFNTRMSMYVCPSNRANVVAFLSGVECGTGSKCEFTKRLRDHIANRYGIKPAALGWPHQIERFAERMSVDWMEAYLLLSLEVLKNNLKSGRGRKRTKGRI